MKHHFTRIFSAIAAIIMIAGSMSLAAFADGVPGDVNGDLKVNNKDAILLFRYCAGWQGLSVDANALDTTGDGEVNNKDAIYLFRYLAGWQNLDPQTPHWGPIDASDYTVTFKDWDGSVLKTQSVSSGANAVPPVAPTKSGVSFLGWSGNYTDVSNDEIVTAVYSDEKNVFVIGSAAGGAGDTVTVLVSIDGSVKTCGFDVNVMYDPNLQLVSYDADLDLDVVVNSAAFENGMKLNFSAATDKTRQRDIIELTFRIKNAAKSMLPISLTVNSIKEISGNNPANTTYSVVNGVIAVN